jgi:hypothetical protein
MRMERFIDVWILRNSSSFCWSWIWCF